MKFPLKRLLADDSYWALCVGGSQFPYRSAPGKGRHEETAKFDSDCAVDSWVVLGSGSGRIFVGNIHGMDHPVISVGRDHRTGGVAP
jgi:hypothetical protein